MAFLGLQFPDWIYDITSTVGGANTYLAMLMIGILFDVHIEKKDRRQILQILDLRYGFNLLFALIIWFLPLPLLLRQVGMVAILAPIPSVAMVYCEKCGCKPEQYGVLNSLSLAISLCLTFPLLLLSHL